VNFLNKKIIHKGCFLSLTTLFILWIILLYFLYPGFQELRHYHPLWLVHHLYPMYYILIGFFLLLFLIIIYKKIQSQIINILFLSLFSLVIYGTPYFVSTYARFPDTISIISNILELPYIFLNNPNAYASNFPASYIFFKIINITTNLDLFYFARIIFSPLCLISIIILWYIFVSKLINPQVGLISSMLIIPTQIIEISITPNSFSILLILILLICCVKPIEFMRKKEATTKYEVLFIFTFGVLILSHPINAGILLLMLFIFYISNHLFKIERFIISLQNLILYSILWISWLIYLTLTGKSIVKLLYNMISTNSQELNVGIQYSLGNTGFIYLFIDQLSAFKYILYGFFTLIILVYLISSLCYNKKISEFQLPLSFLILSGFLICITFLNLIRGGSDIQNILSRTLNFAMYSLSTFIAFFIPSVIDSKTKVTKFVEILFVLLLSFTLLTYPVYSFARDAYINYPTSEEKGRSFSNEYTLGERNSIIEMSKSKSFYSFMYGKIPYEGIMNDHKKIMNDNKIYSNNWYNIGVRT